MGYNTVSRHQILQLTKVKKQRQYSRKVTMIKPRKASADAEFFTFNF